MTASCSCINTRIYLALPHLNGFHLWIKINLIGFVLLKRINSLVLILIQYFDEEYVRENQLSSNIYFDLKFDEEHGGKNQFLSNSDFLGINIYCFKNSNNLDDLVPFMKSDDRYMSTNFMESVLPKMKTMDVFQKIFIWEISISKGKLEEEFFSNKKRMYSGKI